MREEGEAEKAEITLEEEALLHMEEETVIHSEEETEIHIFERKMKFMKALDLVASELDFGQELLDLGMDSLYHVDDLEELVKDMNAEDNVEDIKKMKRGEERPL